MRFFATLRMTIHSSLLTPNFFKGELMERLTKKSEQNKYLIDNSKIEQVVERLALFENIYEDIVASQSEIHKELEKLRNEGKTKTVKFKELMVKKLTNNNMIIHFEFYGIK